jgi:hypothetical protein
MALRPLAKIDKWINTSCLTEDAPMNQREEFLAKALEIHHEYEAASAVIRDMMSKNIAVGPEWDAAVARQIAALDTWMELPGEYRDLNADD